MPSATGTPADPGPSAYPATKAGAAAIARAYFAALLIGAQQNNLGPMKAVAEPDCTCLIQLATFVTKALSAGQHVTGGALMGFKVQAFHSLGPTGATVSVESSEAAGQVVNASGQVQTQDSGSTDSIDEFTLVEELGTWRVEQVTEVS